MSIRWELRSILEETFGIQHVTLQVEPDPAQHVHSPPTTLFDIQALETPDVKVHWQDNDAS